jgi:predicted phosphoribosyltransferase
VFRDRREAGIELGEELRRHPMAQPVVLGLPRGGVPVAAAVASALGVVLDVIVVRKLGLPSQHEVAMGAIGEDGVVIVNQDVMQVAGVSEREFSSVERDERAVLDARVARLRAVRPREPLTGRTALLVDDGIATGATMRAAVQVARAHGAARVVVAAPVAPPDVVAAMQREADEVVVLEQPEPFWAVGSWYRNFDPVSDDEVARLLSGASARTDRAV